MRPGTFFRFDFTRFTLREAAKYGVLERENGLFYCALVQRGGWAFIATLEAR